MKRIKEIILVIFTFIFIPNVSYSNGGYNQTIIHIYGSILSAPCKVKNDVVDVEFGDIIGKYLYLHERTPSIPFYIELEDCRTDIADSVIVSFSGNPSYGDGLDGFLALDGNSVATGVAVGIEMENGQFLSLMDESKAIDIIEGDNILPFKAFVQGDETVLKNKSLGFGEFWATATFILEYL